MANNLIANQPDMYVPQTGGTPAARGFTSGNTRRIYAANGEGGYNSYIPGAGINSLTTLVAGHGILVDPITSREDLDLIGGGNIPAGGGTQTPAAPTAAVVDDTADTFNWTNNPLFPDVGDYEYTTNGGSSYAPVTAKPIVIGPVDEAIGQVGVRVKAAGGNNPSATLYNTVAFTAGQVTLISDNFNRTAGNMGSAVVGGAWNQLIAGLGTNGSIAYLASGTEGFYNIDSNELDVEIQFTAKITSPLTTTDQLTVYFRQNINNTLANSFDCYSGAIGVAVTGGGALTAPAVSNNDVIKIVIEGVDVNVYKNGSGTPFQVATIAAGAAGREYVGLYIGGSRTDVGFEDLTVKTITP